MVFIKSGSGGRQSAGYPDGCRNRFLQISVLFLSFDNQKDYFVLSLCRKVSVRTKLLLCLGSVEYITMKAEKSIYPFRVEPQDVDFTLRATISSLGSAVLNTAGIDAHGKGFGVDALHADNYSWVLSRIAFEFDSRPEQYADYRIATWISDYGRVLSTRNFTLCDSSGNEFGRAVSQWAMIDLSTRAAVDLSGVGDAHADAVVDAPPPAAMPRKIRAVAPSVSCQHRVVYSDIDFNRHVNTMRYIEMMLDMLPVERLTSEAPVRLDVHFLRECRLGQTLTVGAEFRDEGALFEIGSGEGAVAVRAAVEWK